MENEAGKGFLNEAQKGSLKIVKTSSDGKVEGFSFRVIGKDYDQTFTTDKKGEIAVEGAYRRIHRVRGQRQGILWLYPACRPESDNQNRRNGDRHHAQRAAVHTPGMTFTLGCGCGVWGRAFRCAGLSSFGRFKREKGKKREEREKTSDSTSLPLFHS